MKEFKNDMNAVRMQNFRRKYEEHEMCIFRVQTDIKMLHILVVKFDNGISVWTRIHLFILIFLHLFFQSWNKSADLFEIRIGQHDYGTGETTSMANSIIGFCNSQ